MFCPECGKSNPEGNSNCQFCGAELIDNSAERLPSYNFEAYASKFKNVDYKSAVQTLKSKKKIIIPVIVLIFLIIIFAVVGSIFSSPERLVKSYFDSYINKDYSKMYSYLAVSEDDFINKESFQKYMETSSQIDGSRISNYTVTSAEQFNTTGKKVSSENKLINEYVITYLMDGDNQEHTYTVYLSKQSGKKWLFFDKYKVTLENAICNNYIIRTPAGVKLEVDGKVLEGTANKENPSWYDYKINSIFLGEHTYKVSGDFISGYEQSFYVNGGGSGSGYGHYDDYDLLIEEFTLNDVTMDSLAKNAQSTINAMYQGAIAGKKVEELGVQVITEDGSNFNQEYNSLLDRAKHEDGSGLKSIAFSNFQTEDTYLNVEDGFEFRIELNFNTNYVTTYKSGDTFEEYTTSDPLNSRADITYRFEGDAWKISNIYLRNTY